MRRPLLTLLLALLPACAPKVPPTPVAAGPLVTLPCDWAAGTAFSYEHGRRRTDARTPRLAEVSTTTPITVTVTQPGNPANLDYATGAPRLQGPEELVGPMRALYGAVVPPMKLVLTDGSLSALTNQAELIDAMEPTLRAATPGQEEVITKTLALMRDPGAGQRLLLRDPSQFFALHCVAMHVDEVIDSPTEFPNPFGGPPIAGQSRVALTAHDPAAGTVTFTTRDAVDPEALGPVIDAVITQFAPTPLTPEKRAEILAQLPPIASVTTGTMVYSTADGFPLRIDIHQETSVPGLPPQRTDDWTWARVAAE